MKYILFEGSGFGFRCFLCLLKWLGLLAGEKKPVIFVSSLCGVTFSEHYVIACISFKLFRISRESLLLDCAFQQIDM